MQAGKAVLVLLGAAIGVAASLLAGGLGVAALFVQSPAAPISATATEAPPPTSAASATPVRTEVPAGTPEPTQAPSSLRRDLRIGIAEPYISREVATGLRATSVGGAIDDSSTDIQTGNVVVIRARPKGSRDFALTFTSQLSLAGNRIVVTPLSSSALLTPFRAQIAKTVEDNINARVDRYRENTAFRILGISTTADEINVDLSLG